MHDTLIQSEKLNDKPKNAENYFKECRYDVRTREERQNQFNQPVCESTVNDSF